MAIANAVQRGSTIYVYDEKGSQLCTLAAKDGLHGFTGSSVSVRGGSTIYVYNERGSQTGTMAAR